jgi:hypothetical protein
MSWPTLRRVDLRLFKPWKVIKRTAGTFRSLASANWTLARICAGPLNRPNVPTPLCSGALVLDYRRLWTWAFVILIALHRVSLKVLALMSTELVVVDIELACSNRGGWYPRCLRLGKGRILSTIRWPPINRQDGSHNFEQLNFCCTSHLVLEIEIRERPGTPLVYVFTS